MSRTVRTPSAARLLSLAAVAALAACGGGGDGDPTGPSPTQSALVVRNASAQPVTSVHFSDCAQTSWGDNRLGAGEEIAPGAKRTWQVLPGCYDVRVRGAAGGSATFYDRSVDAGQTRELTVSGTAQLRSDAARKWE